MDPTEILQPPRQPVATVPCKLHVLILVHPQEQDHQLGTAPLIREILGDQVRTRVGLSWRNLASAWESKSPKSLNSESGAPLKQRAFEPDPKRWITLYLGSGAKSRAPTLDPRTRPGTSDSKKPLLIPVDRKGVELSARERAEVIQQTQGIILLDGTWSQAKALWWRNAWLLKTRRAVIAPGAPSLYGKLRKEPRRECVSTLESLARALGDIPGNELASGALVERFAEFLKSKK